LIESVITLAGTVDSGFGGERVAGEFDAGATGPLELGFVAGGERELGLHLHRVGETAGEDGEHEDGHHHHNDGNPLLFLSGVDYFHYRMPGRLRLPPPPGLPGTLVVRECWDCPEGR